VGSSSPCSQIISSHTLALRSPAPEAQRYLLNQQYSHLSMTLLLHNKRVLRRSVIHSREKRCHLAGAVQLEAVVRIRRRTEEAVRWTSGRGEPCPVVFHTKLASLAVSSSLSFVVITFAQCPNSIHLFYLPVQISFACPLLFHFSLPSLTPLFQFTRIQSLHPRLPPYNDPSDSRSYTVGLSSKAKLALACRKDVGQQSALHVSMV